MTHRHRLPSVLASTLATSVAVALLALAAPAPALAATPVLGAPASAPTGWVRLGHLSPRTPPVDIYLALFGQPEKVAFRKAGYGNVTPYSTLSPGAYTVSMRLADAPATSAPALSANVEVKAGVAYTALVFENGPNGTIRPRLLTDDLVPPAAGSGKVRLVQGATGRAPVDVTAVGGPSLATGLNYGDSSPYTSVPEGRWSVSLKSGAETKQATVDVRSGSVSTVVVVDTPGVGLALTPLRDSTGTASAPSGGTETGAGGTVGPSPVLPVLAALLAGMLAASLAVLMLRRRTHG